MDISTGGDSKAVHILRNKMGALMLRPQTFYLIILNRDENKTSFPTFKKATATKKAALESFQLH